MEVIQDLLTLQLESMEAANPALAILYGEHVVPVLSMISGPDTDGSQSPAESSDTDSVVEAYLQHGLTMPHHLAHQQLEYGIIYDADPVEPYQGIINVQAPRQARILADLREANNPTPARCTLRKNQRVRTPLVSVQPFYGYAAISDFRKTQRGYTLQPTLRH